MPRCHRVLLAEKKILQNFLVRHRANYRKLYALAAGAAGVQLLALAPPAEAEIVYTGAHQAIGRNQTLFASM